MATASHYRWAATQLDGYAADLDHADSSVLIPAANEIPQVLQGDATGWLQGEFDAAGADLRHAAGLLREAASWARAEAARLDAAATAAAAAAAAAEEEAATGDDGPTHVGGGGGNLYY